MWYFATNSRRSVIFLPTLVAACFAAMLFFAACGDDDSGDTTTPTATTTSTSAPTVTPTETAPATPSSSSTETASPTGSASATPGEAACEFQPTGELTAYMRPSMDAEVFGVVPPDRSYPVSGRTGEGWIGFVPAVAQAANVGPFRSRYIPPDGAYDLVGDCADLPVLPSLPADACFTMAMTDVTVRTEASASASAAFTLEAGQWAQVSDSQAVDGAIWLRVQSSTGDSEGASGWLDGQDANFNGPCDEYQSP